MEAEHALPYAIFVFLLLLLLLLAQSLTHCHSFRVCVYRVFSIAFVFVLCIDFTFTPRKLLVRNWMADRWWDFVDAPFVSEYIEGLLL